MKIETTNIIIADSHEIFREGLKMFLEKLTNVNVVAEVSNGYELLDILRNSHADIIFMDIEMSGMDGIEASKIILRTFPEIKIVALTMFNDPEQLALICAAGVKYFLAKNADKEEFAIAIQSIKDGKIHFPVQLNQISNNLKFTVMKTTKILIVDDDIDVITVIETILSKKGYKVITAMNKEEGMKKIKEETPDLAILDVMMTTQYEGFEMAKEITENPSLNNIPVLMQTSVDVLITTKPDVQAMAREFRKNPGFKDLHVLLVKDIVTGKAGIDYLSEKGQNIWFPVDGFISKPVDTSKLISEIEKILKAKN